MKRRGDYRRGSKRRQSPTYQQLRLQARSGMPLSGGSTRPTLPHLIVQRQRIVSTGGGLVPLARQVSTQYGRKTYALYLLKQNTSRQRHGATFFPTFLPFFSPLSRTALLKPIRHAQSYFRDTKIERSLIRSRQKRGMPSSLNWMAFATRTGLLDSMLDYAQANVWRSRVPICYSNHGVSLSINLSLIHI